MSLFIGDRLKIARVFRKYTLTGLASKVDISKQSLSLYENNKVGVNLPTLTLLANTLGFPREFFTQSASIVGNNSTVYFRRKKTANKSDEETQKLKTELLFFIYKNLMNHIEFPQLNIKEYDADAIKMPHDFAQLIRKHWELDNKPIKNLKRLLESHGIPVVLLQSDKKIDAYSIKRDGYSMIILNEQQSESRVLFDLAHELGHILMHPWNENLDELTKEQFDAREEQANAFASAFLLPEDAFLNDIKYYNPNKLKSYVELKKKWKVSIQALIRRAKDLEIIDAEQVTKFYKQINTYKWRLWEPGDIEFKIDNTLITQSIELLVEEYSAKFIMKDLADQGLAMNPDDVELLLGLNPNTLSTEKRNLVNLRIVK